MNNDKKFPIGNEKIVSEIFSTIGHSAKVTSICYSYDGNYIISGSDDNTIKVWMAQTGQLIRTFENPNESQTRNVSISPNGQIIIINDGFYLYHIEKIYLIEFQSGKVLNNKIIGSKKIYPDTICFSSRGDLIGFTKNKTVILYDFQLDKYLELQENHTRAQIIKFSNNELLVSGNSDGSLTIWSRFSEQIIAKCKGHKNEVIYLCFSYNDKYMASAGSDGTVIIWDMKTYKLFKEFKAHNEIKAMQFSSNDLSLVTVGSNTVKIWRIISQKLSKIYKKGKYTSYASSICGKFFAFSDNKKRNNLILFKTSSGKRISKKKNKLNISSPVCFSPDSEKIATGHYDGSLKIYNLKSLKLNKMIQGSGNCPLSVKFDLDNQILVSGHKDGSIKLWKPDSGELLKSIVSNSKLSPSYSVQFSPDNQIIASGNNGKIKFWSVKSLKNTKIISPPSIKKENFKLLKKIFGKLGKPHIKTISFSPDGHKIACGVDRQVMLWDIKLKRPIHILREYSIYFNHYIQSVCFSPDGKILAAADFDGSIMLWEIASGKLIRTLPNVDALITSIIFTNCGKFIICATIQGHLSVWDIQYGKLIKIYKNITNVNCVSICPMDKILVSGHHSGKVKLFDFNTGKRIITFLGHSHYVYSVCFDSSGKRLASCGQDNTIKIWNMTSEAPIRIIPILPNNEWLSYNPITVFYDSSENGDEYASIRFDNDTCNWEPLSLFKNREVYKKKENKENK